LTFDGCRFVKIIHFVTSMGAPTSRGGTTTVWRPRVRIDVPNVGDAENTDTSREELTKKGTKRKRAPKHHGPCEHGVKHRSKCKVCGACPHGRRRHQCKECGGSQICEHGRRRCQCKECGGSAICEHGRRRSVCKECGGWINLRARSCALCSARSAVGHRYASTVVIVQGVQRKIARSAVGASICEHGRQRSKCKECGGSSNMRARS